MGKEVGSPLDQQEIVNRILAQNGSSILTSGTTTGDWSGILVINDCVLSAVICSGMTGASSLVGITLPAGIYIPGNFTSIGVTSGVVAAINR